MAVVVLSETAAVVIKVSVDRCDSGGDEDKDDDGEGVPSIVQAEPHEVYPAACCPWWRRHAFQAQACGKQRHDHTSLQLLGNPLACLQRPNSSSVPDEECHDIAWGRGSIKGSRS